MMWPRGTPSACALTPVAATRPRPTREMASSTACLRSLLGRSCHGLARRGRRASMHACTCRRTS
eukprot:10158870-Alexandrium_andersonii.AAC.1